VKLIKVENFNHRPIVTAVDTILENESSLTTVIVTYVAHTDVPTIMPSARKKF
jgi:hypothetical protein